MHLKNLNLIAFLAIAFCLISGSAHATDWYIRTDGGDNTECDGTHDSAQSGATDSGDAGSLPDCAFEHPAWVLSTPQGTTQLMQGGDTLIIGPGEYPIGFGMPNGCPAGYADFPYDADCMLNPPPSGTSINNKTKIYGAGWDSGCSSAPQLWGTKSVLAVMRLHGVANLDMRCLEITDHKACGYAVGSPQCSTSYPLGSGETYGRAGVIASSGSNWYWADINIHGMSSQGGVIGNITNWETDRVKFVGNYFAGLDMDNTPIGGTGMNGGLHWHKNMVIRYSGFLEAYPASSTITESDYSQAYDQNNTGYGEGFGTYFTNGDWTFDDADISHNVSDGIDLLYHLNSGTLRIHRGRFEGNMGNQIKTGARTNIIENAKIVGNCRYIDTHGFTTGPDITFCRASGTALQVAPKQGQKTYIRNSTFWGNSGTIIDNGELGHADTCDGTEVMESVNTIYYGAERQDGAGTKASYFYCSGSDGNEAGVCCSGSTKLNPTISYSTVFNTKDTPTGTGVSLVNPRIAEATLLDAEVDSDDYDFNLTVNSTAVINQGRTSITLDGTSNDFNNYSRGSQWDFGAFEYGSTPTTGCGDGIINGSEQCDGLALNGQSCTSNGYDEGTLGCTSACVYDFSDCNDFCGNGTIESPEECDGTNLNSNTCVTEGFESGTISCNGCQLNTSACFTDPCGNGTIQSPEECDGTNLNGNTCQTEGFTYGTATCLVDCTLNTSGCSNPSCGNGIVESGEQCDGAALNSKTCTTQGFDSGTLACNGNCTFNTSSCAFNCGNGTIQAPEACDGSNLNSKTCVTQGFDSGTLACNSTCTLNTSGCVNNFCGDGAIGDAESCDGAELNNQTCVTQGFTSGSLTCRSNCTFNTSACVTVLPAVCGNGVIEGNEVCDGAALNSQTCVTQGFVSGSLSCSSNCAFNTSLCSNAVCGNGIIDSGESCDGAALNSATCVTRGFDSGTLTCANNCTFNTSACAYTQNTNSKMIIGGKVAAGGVGSIQ